MREFLTVNEVAERWKLKPGSVYEYIRSGQLRAIKFGKAWRIELKDLENFENKLKTQSEIELRISRIGY